MIFLCGCGGEPRPADLPALHPCFITINVDGKPLEGASVDLHAETPSKWFAFGITNQNGLAVMKTQSKYLGVISGKYVVTVIKEGNDPNWTADPDRPDLDIPVVSFVAAQYADPTRSPLQCVVEEGKNQFQFNLEPPNEGK
ncbi:MAG: hypothetical protein LBI18_09670 [Planctomycetaceae bacterium]|nr:hypothetical protein [Planctomycetaceae bacterium]